MVWGFMSRLVQYHKPAVKRLCDDERFVHDLFESSSMAQDLDRKEEAARKRKRKGHGGTRTEEEEGEYEEEKVDLPLTYAATAKAKNLLGFEPKVRLEEGMQLFIDWYLAYSGSKSLCASECADQERCIPSFFDSVRQKSMNATSECSIVVYTVYIGERNITLHNPLQESAVEETTTCYIAFVPRGKIIEQPGGVWDVMPLDVSHSLHGIIASFLDSSSSHQPCSLQPL